MCHLQGIRFKKRLKVKGWEKIHHVNINHKYYLCYMAGVATLGWGKVGIRAKKTIWDKEGHFIRIKWPIYPIGTTVLNVCAPNNRASESTKLNWDSRKEKLTNPDKVGDFQQLDNTTKSRMDQNIAELNTITINHQDWINVYGTLSPPQQDTQSS